MFYQSSLWDNGPYPEVWQNLKGWIIKVGRWDAHYVINIIHH